MTLQMKTPPGGYLAGLNDSAFPGGNGQSNRANATARQAETTVCDERELLRDDVFEASSEALNYLVALRSFVASDDQPGLKYAYAKFATYGRVVAVGCKKLMEGAND